METGNDEYDIIISGEMFEQIMVRVVLPRALVDEVTKRKNRRALDLVVLALKDKFRNIHTPEHKVLNYTRLSFDNFSFTVNQRSV